MFWRWKSQSGRPPIPADLQAFIRRMACDNPTWGEERIANELWLKLGLRVLPRTVRKDLPRRLDHGRYPHDPSQRWQNFVRNHAKVIVACDFCTVVNATFRLLYVFVVMEYAPRRILHANVTAHPTAHFPTEIIPIGSVLKSGGLNICSPVSQHQWAAMFYDWSPSLQPPLGLYSRHAPHMLTRALRTPSHKELTR